MSDLVGNPEDRFSRVAAHIRNFKTETYRLKDQLFRPTVCLQDNITADIDNNLKELHSPDITNEGKWCTSFKLSHLQDYGCPFQGVTSVVVACTAVLVVCFSISFTFRAFRLRIEARFR